jgi:hypothetical protein
MDGSSPLTSGPVGGGGHQEATLTSSQIAGKTDRLWAFSVVGVGVRLQDLRPPFQFKELRVPYTYGVTIKVETSPEAPFLLEHVDFHSMVAQWRFADNGSMGTDGVITMTRPVFDISGVVPLSQRGQVPGTTGDFPVWAFALLTLAMLGAAAVLYNRERIKQGKAPIAAISALDGYAVAGWTRARNAGKRVLRVARMGPRGAKAAGGPVAPDGGIPAVVAPSAARGGLAGVMGRASAGLKKVGGSASGLKGKLTRKRPDRV